VDPTDGTAAEETGPPEPRTPTAAGSENGGERTRAAPGVDAEPLAVLDAVPVCVFVLSPEREMLHWNQAAEELCGTAWEGMVGSDEVSVAFYQDSRRAMTLADEVVVAPESADEEYGVRRSTDVSYTRYDDTSRMVGASGEEVDA
jgi:methyl-accepting chemotaxis protein